MGSGQDTQLAKKQGRKRYPNGVCVRVCIFPEYILPELAYLNDFYVNLLQIQV
jgi:hypothetical protein